MIRKDQRFSSNSINPQDISPITDAPPSYTERVDDDGKRAVEVCGPPPNPDFEPVERQRHFGILQYTVNERFRKITAILIIIVLLMLCIIGLFLFLFLRSNNSTGVVSSTISTSIATTPQRILRSTTATSKNSTPKVTSPVSTPTVTTTTPMPTTTTVVKTTTTIPTTTTVVETTTTIPTTPTTTTVGKTTTTTTAVRTTTVTRDTSCTPTTPSTFLFAYSNDLDLQSLLKKWREFVDNQGAFQSKFYIIATIRFDVKDEENIEYNTNWADADSTVVSHFPDATLGFTSSDTGSDVLKTIEKFLDNFQAPVCGSQIYVVLKRFPNEADVSQIVGKLRQYHSYITIQSVITPSGGFNRDTMYKVATQTNGLCAFDDDLSWFHAVYSSVFNPYLVYAANAQVFGKGFDILPPLIVPFADPYQFRVTIQDHAPLDDFKFFNLTWYNSGSSYSDSLTFDDIFPQSWANKTYLPFTPNFDTVVYNMTLDYEYFYNRVQYLLIRIYTDSPINDWLPYNN